jgi:hypothetical protein
VQLAGVHCPPNTHLWVENNGNYSEEGFNNIKGNIWGKEGNIWEKVNWKDGQLFSPLEIRLLFSFSLDPQACHLPYFLIHAFVF